MLYIVFGIRGYDSKSAIYYTSERRIQVSTISWVGAVRVVCRHAWCQRRWCTEIDLANRSWLQLV
jgi:predicted secreted hydrolase